MLNISSVTKLAGGQPLFEGVSFQVYAGEKVGIVGPNGAGKTTLFRLIVGEEMPDSGAVSLQNGTTIAYFSQNVGEMKGRSALGEVIAGNPRIEQLASILAHCEERLCDPLITPEEMDTVLTKMGRLSFGSSMARHSRRPRSQAP